MTSQKYWLLLVAMALPAAVGAQRPNRDEIGVVRAAVDYYRDTRVKGAIVIDPTSVYHRGPLVDPAVVDEVVSGARTKKGRFADYIACDDSIDIAKQRKQRVCTMRNDVKAVVTFSELSIRDHTATRGNIRDGAVWALEPRGGRADARERSGRRMAGAKRGRTRR
jgi:hypothetical protein